MVGFVTARGETDIAASPILDPRRRRGETPFGQAFATYRAALEREDQQHASTRCVQAASTRPEAAVVRDHLHDTTSRV
jgi:hypothetical protein